MMHWTSLYRLPPPPHPPTWDMETPPGPPPAMGPPASDTIWWSSRETCLNLFIGPHCTSLLPPHPTLSYRIAFFLKIFTHLVIYPPGRSSPREQSSLCPAFRHLCCFPVHIKARWNQQLCNVCPNLWPSDHQSVSLFPFHEVPCVMRP